MEAMIALGLLMAVVFGGMTLALVMGYLGTEEARARAQEQARRRGRVVRAAEAIPSFFVTPDRRDLPLERPGLDELLLARLESHVKEEQALVSEFVHSPSVHSLYRQGPQALRMH